MTQAQATKFSRRQFAASASLLALGSALAPALAMADDAGAAGLRGPYLDLNTSAGNLIAIARLKGNTDLAKCCYTYFTGNAIAISPANMVRPFCKVRGLGQSRLLRLDSQPGWHLLRREIAYFCDNRSDAPLTTLANPFTGETVPVAHQLATVTSDLAEFVHSDWRICGESLVFSHSFHNVDIDIEQFQTRTEFTSTRIHGAETTTQVVSVADMQNENLRLLRSCGTTVRATAWPTWMLMGSAPGQCIYNCTMHAGFETVEELPMDLVNYTQTHYPDTLRSFLSAVT